MSSVEQALHEVRFEIARALHDASRAEDDACLIAVSKTIAGEGIAPALEANQRVFGENYVQEAQAKWLPLKEQYEGVELHLIGPLQSNKVREALEVFDVIQTLDRLSLAQALAKAVQKRGKCPRLLIQVNTGEEPQKGGVLPHAFPDFLQQCQNVYDLPIEGLMCIPPVDQPPSAHFAFLRKLANECGLKVLSMGMSADFEQAIMLGATHVRVGTRIFGQRALHG
jgi:PLP dependent protein